MKALPILPAAVCCAFLAVPAAAETCDQRFPGSCRVEVSTTVVQAPGQSATPRRAQARQAKRPHRAKHVRAAKRPRHAGKTRIAAAPRARSVSIAPAPTVPVALPKISPARSTPTVGHLDPKPGVLVDDAFNVLTTTDVADVALEEALLSKRDQMLGMASRWSE